MFGKRVSLILFAKEKVSLQYNYSAPKVNTAHLDLCLTGCCPNSFMRSKGFAITSNRAWKAEAMTVSTRRYLTKEYHQPGQWPHIWG
jgi:hypothetical protein